MQGDIDVEGSPNSACAPANSTGITLTYNTCIYGYISRYNMSGYVCDPHHEFGLDGEAFDDSKPSTTICVWSQARWTS